MDLSFSKKNVFGLVGLLIALCGCRPDPLVIDGLPTMKQQIVVSTQITTQSSVILLLTKSFSPLGGDKRSNVQKILDKIAIKDATVTLSSNGKKYQMLHLGNGIYTSGSTPLKEGLKYNLHIDSPTMGVVTSSTTVQRFVAFEQVNASIVDVGFDTLTSVSYKFRDIPGKNHYMINTIPIKLNRSFLQKNIINPKIFTKILLSDIKKSNPMISGKFTTFIRGKQSKGDTLIVQLSQISKEYFNYLSSIKKSGRGVYSFVREPLNFPTNIEGGLGWFNLHTPDIRVIRAK